MGHSEPTLGNRSVGSPSLVNSTIRHAAGNMHPRVPGQVGRLTAPYC